MGLISLPEKGPDRIAIIDTRTKVRQLQRLLASATHISYDVETNGFKEHESTSRIITLAGTCRREGGLMTTWALPLYHPESPWKACWRSLLRELAPALEEVPKQIAHNGKFDARWMRQFGVQMRCEYDTMLACHLIDENERKGLKEQAQRRYKIEDWSINTRSLLDTPLAEVLHYNALDTWWTWRLYEDTKVELSTHSRSVRIFQMLLMPALETLIEAERRGAWIDVPKTKKHFAEALAKRREIDDQLWAFVPDPESPGSSVYAESNDSWPTYKSKKKKQVPVNFNASLFARWWLFEHLGLPIIARGKTKVDKATGKESPGDPSMAEDILKELRGLHPVIELMLARVTWQKYCTAFFPAWLEAVDENGRIHTSFKLAGTVTGRLSSGKEDADKVSGRVQNRGVNLQQVPREPLLRGCFGAPQGWKFVEADFSQVELRLAAFMSRDKNLLSIYQRGLDVHTATASWVLGIPMAKVSKDDRKKAKAVNFGFLYGMGAAKFVMTAFEKYDLRFTIDEAKEIRREFFRQFPGLIKWHSRQRRLVHENQRVLTPMGRIRHLPDVKRKWDQSKVSEAERQAINSPVQGMASDMALLAMNILDRQLRVLEHPAFVVGTVHDAINFEVREDWIDPVCTQIKQVMENLPLKKKFGVALDVPIEVEIKVGDHWSEGEIWQGNKTIDTRSEI